MESDMICYGKFVIFNGMIKSCEISKKPAEYLLRSLYQVVEKQQASIFFIKGLRDYLTEYSEEEACMKLKIPQSLIEKSRISHEEITKKESINFFATAMNLLQKQKKFDHIDRYKNLELSKSIIFKHLRGIN